MSREIDVEVLPPAGGGRSHRWERPGCGLLSGWLGLAWGVELVDSVFMGWDLDQYGIRPRSLDGLAGIFLSPWLHGSFGHLLANSMAFLGLGMLVLIAEGKRFMGTTIALMLISGFGTWLIGRPGTVHIGASGLIYGYFGYLLARVIWERKVGWTLLGIMIGVIYGGMISGVLPSGGAISWEGHLAGMVAGMWLGWTHVKAAERGARHE